jgi:hypothetical protein
MRENESVSLHPAKAQEAKRGQQSNRGAYQAPRLVVVGSAVELVQGARQGGAIDGATSFRPW